MAQASIDALPPPMAARQQVSACAAVGAAHRPPQPPRSPVSRSNTPYSSPSPPPSRSLALSFTPSLSLDAHAHTGSRRDNCTKAPLSTCCTSDVAPPRLLGVVRSGSRGPTRRGTCRNAESLRLRDCPGLVTSESAHIARRLRDCLHAYAEESRFPRPCKPAVHAWLAPCMRREKPPPWPAAH